MALTRGVATDEDGFSVIQHALCMALTLFVLLWAANLAVDAYGKGAVRSAVDEAARAGSRVDVDSVSTCERRGHQVLSGILGGPMGAGVRLSCTEGPGVVRASAQARFASWAPPFPAVAFRATGVALKEQAHR